jgi:hypothetical protein
MTKAELEAAVRTGARIRGRLIGRCAARQRTPTHTVALLRRGVEGIDGSTVPIGDIDGFTDRIQHLNDHRQTLRDMAVSARAWVAERFNLEDMVARYHDLVSQVPLRLECRAD